MQRDDEELLLFAAGASALAVGLWWWTSGGDQTVKNAVRNLTPAGRRAGLLPEVREALDAAIAELAADGIRVHVGQTIRSSSDQLQLVAAGASGTTRSWHLLGRAADIYPYDPATGRLDMAGSNDALYRRMHAAFTRQGFKNLAYNPDGTRRYITTTKDGKKRKIWDGGHVEFTGGMTWAQAAEEFKARKAEIA